VSQRSIFLTQERKMALLVGIRIVFSVSVFLMMLGFAVAQDRGQDRNTPGEFDYYVLSLSWSPTFCETATGNARRQQCGARPYSFVVHGLWPQYERGFPESCQVPPPRLDRNIMTSMLDLMPAPGLVFHEWDQHGTCSGLQPREYFDLVRKARERVRIPEQYSNPTAPLSVTPGQVIDAFTGANDGLPPSGIAIDCSRRRLREVRICLTRDLKFRDCSRSAQRACRSERLVMPPVRGG
jgi:ribonuclease T2